MLLLFFFAGRPGWGMVWIFGLMMDGFVCCYGYVSFGWRCFEVGVALEWFLKLAVVQWI